MEEVILPCRASRGLPWGFFMGLHGVPWLSTSMETQAYFPRFAMKTSRGNSRGFPPWKNPLSPMASHGIFHGRCWFSTTFHRTPWNICTTHCGWFLVSDGSKTVHRCRLKRKANLWHKYANGFTCSQPICVPQFRIWPADPWYVRALTNQ